MTVNSIPSPDGKLAYIGKIIKIEPISNADLIESATVVCGVGGQWQGIVGKGSFSLGDECVVYLQDAVLPEDCGLDFMSKFDWTVAVKRFRGAPSECLIAAKSVSGDVGQDVTNVLRVRKFYEPLPKELDGVALGYLPSFLTRTHEFNFQAVPHLVEFMQGKDFVATQKYDGESCVVYSYQGHYGVCSRQVEYNDGDNVFWKTCGHLDIPEGYALKLEIHGRGIKKNKLGLDRISAAAFTLYDIAKHEYLPYDAMYDFCLDRHIEIVRVVRRGNFNYSTDDLRRLAEGTYPNGKQQEGIVIRPTTEARVNGDRASFKVLNLLYEK